MEKLFTAAKGQFIDSSDNNRMISLPVGSTVEEIVIPQEVRSVVVLGMRERIVSQHGQAVGEPLLHFSLQGVVLVVSQVAKARHGNIPPELREERAPMVGIDRSKAVLIGNVNVERWSFADKDVRALVADIGGFDR